MVTTANTRKGPIMPSATSEPCAPTCGVCGDTGFVFLPGDSKRVTRCECRTSDLKLRSILPPLFQHARLSDFTRPLMDAGQSWLAHPTSGLVLTGPTGTGKTWFAAGLVRGLAETGRKVTFKPAEDFYLELRSGFDNRDVSEVSLLSRFADVEFLVLDDIGAGSLSDYERRSTLHVLDLRMRYLRPTIVTSNLTLEVIAAAMDERIASRLGSFTRIALTGRDRRGRT
jgi:chromosomal replication initiation ATPase DnaA